MKKPSRNTALKLFNIAAMTGLLAFVLMRHSGQSEYKEECAAVSDASALAQKLPESSRNLALLSAQPLTGMAIRNLQEQGSPLRLCRVIKLGGNAAGGYQPPEKTMRMLERHENPYVLSHELYHASQDTRGSLAALSNPELAIQDQIMANLVIEASAVGYTFMAFKEIDKSSPGAYAAFAAADYSFNMSGSFTRAYDQAIAKGAGEQEALRAGGTAVVEGLLRGEDAYWSVSYLIKSMENYLAPNRPAAPQGIRHDPSYRGKLAAYFNNAASVAPGISILPSILSDADPAAIDRLLTIDDNSRATQKKPQTAATSSTLIRSGSSKNTA
jgi:hypothetical protein